MKEKEDYTSLVAMLEKMGNNITYARDLPTDGSLFTMSKYLEELSSNSDNDFFRRYLNHLQYFIGIYDMKGSREFNRISPAILRHCLEFGKVAVTRFNGKILPIAITKIEYDMYGELTILEGIPVRMGYGYTNKLKSIKCDPKTTAVLKHNYLALPMLYF